MMMPDRTYSDTSQTEEIIFSVVSYEKLNTEQNFKFGTEGWEGSSGMDTSTANTKVEASSTATNAALDYYYTTQANQKYKLVLSLGYGTVDSIDLKIQNQGPLSLLISEDLIAQCKLVYEFTPTEGGEDGETVEEYIERNGGKDEVLKRTGTEEIYYRSNDETVVIK